jgi:hypothetical protein
MRVRKVDWHGSPKLPMGGPGSHLQERRARLSIRRTSSIPSLRLFLTRPCLHQVSIPQRGFVVVKTHIPSFLPKARPSCLFKHITAWCITLLFEHSRTEILKQKLSPVIFRLPSCTSPCSLEPASAPRGQQASAAGVIPGKPLPALFTSTWCLRS